MDLWKPVTEALKQQIVEHAVMRGEALDRRTICQQILKVRDNDFGDLVVLNIRSMFTADENFENLKLFPHTATNLMERVLDDVALLYQEPAKRYLNGQQGTQADETGDVGKLIDMEDDALVTMDAESEVQASPFVKWQNMVDPDSLFDEVHKLALVMPVVWIFPVVRYRPGASSTDDVELSYDLYTPATADVELNAKDKKRVDAWYTWRMEEFNGKPQLVYHRWTATGMYQRFDKDWKPISPEEDTGLGRLPVTDVRLGIARDTYFLDGKGGDLYDGTLEVCVLRTLQNARYRDSSFKQLVIDGSPDNLPPGQVYGNPAMPIFTPEGSASVLDMQAHLDQLSMVVGERIREIHTKYGISPAQWTMSQKAESGFSKSMDNAKITARNRKERKWLARAESDFYRLCALRLKKNPVPAIGDLDPEARFGIDYADPQFTDTPLTQAKADAVAIQLGKTNILEVVKRENPDLTDTEAVRQLALNRKINMRFLIKDDAGHTMQDLLALTGANAWVTVSATPEIGGQEPAVAGASNGQAEGESGAPGAGARKAP